ncbi:tetratricopeptide repeat protein [Streptomyces sp. TLI_55]|uniref:tetratricopeptide repeat protein n=1 Tax=Streptomyces sp. TLI_55 TaxID=1938861 RepID=UPI000BC6EF8D|nr:tetratricopeptide repeat protein [Streptomyces sp. TLI_55]SNX62839.1 tetratricopeptide repeat protein [Streptomyces sp. TLI_55]
MSASFDSRVAVPGASVMASGASAVSAGGGIGQAITGSGSVGLHIDRATLLSPEACPPAASVDWSPGVTNIPARDPMFVGRERELAILNADLAEPLAPGRTVVAHAVHGLGGIGKSTLAAHWATRRAATGTPVWWITAESRPALDAGLAALAAALQPSLVTLLPQEQLTEWALQWLGSHTGWLLVLDNVSDPVDIDVVLSRATSGRLLITSRRATSWRGRAEPIELDVLSTVEATALFTRGQGTPGGDQDDITELCTELGCLPLAVAQAAAYCEQHDCSAREYLDDLADYPADMYEATDESGDAERTIARIWHVTLARIADDPLAVHILLMLAWYAPEEIPRALLDSLGTPPKVRGSLGRLAAHSMITQYDGKLGVHRLVQAVSRTPAQGDSHRDAAAIEAARVSAAESLLEAFPEGDPASPELWPDVRRLLPHAEALAEKTAPEADTETEATVFYMAAVHLRHSGVRSAERSLRLLLRAEAAFVRLLGSEGRATLAARVDLPESWWAVGDERRGQEATETLYEDCARALGEDDPVTLRALTMVAETAQRRGDLDRAQGLLEEIAGKQARILGDSHPATLWTRGHIGMCLLGRGEYGAARLLWENLFEQCVTELGAEHYVSLGVQSHLLMALPVSKAMEGPTGDFLKGMVAPGDETSALETLTALAKTGIDSGFVEELLTGMPTPSEHVETAERYVAACRRVFGDDHMKTLVARMTLVQAYGETMDGRRLAEAVADLRADSVRILGPDYWFMERLNRLLRAFDLVVDALRQVDSMRAMLISGLEGADVSGAALDDILGVFGKFAGALQELLSPTEQGAGPAELPLPDTVSDAANALTAMLDGLRIPDAEEDGPTR